MKKAIPIGISNYRKLKENGYYSVDKSMLIYDFLSRKNEVTLITRPRRFGKSLNMSMLAEFFDITKNSKEIFKNTKIMKTEFADQMNAYPVIYLSFANAKGDLFNIVNNIKSILIEEYVKYEYVFEDISSLLVSSYQTILKYLKESDLCSLRGINDAISFLSKRLESYYQKKVILLIDEFDTPFIESHIGGFYDKLHNDLSVMLSSSLKNNNSLQYALLTGIQRVAKESIFSGLNNLKVCTVANKEYAHYFGFTVEETKELLEYYGLEYNDDVKDMYDGYRIGNENIYNPWSILCYADNKELMPYWVNTSANKMILAAMDSCDDSFRFGYESLIKNGYVETSTLMETSFFEQSQTSSLWGLLLNAGYLTIQKVMNVFTSDFQLKIPNHEVEKEFTSITAHYLEVSETILNDIGKAFTKKDKESFYQNYQSILQNNVSYYDLKGENSYHTLLLGMCSCLSKEYTIKSNQESGTGRADIILHAKKPTLPSYVIEMKYTRDDTQNLYELAEEAIYQIEKKKYGSDITGNLIFIGLSHCGKTAEMIWKETSSI